MTTIRHVPPLYIGTEVERAAYTTLILPGALWWATDTGILWVYSGTAWVKHYNPASGIIVWRSNAHTIGDSAWTAMSFDRELTDTEGAFTPTATQVAPSVAGYYVVTVSVVWSANGTGTRGIRLVKNGAQYPASQVIVPDGTEPVSLTVACAMVYLDGSTDYIEAEVYQSSGGNLNTASTGDDPDLRDRYSLYLQFVGR